MGFLLQTTNKIDEYLTIYEAYDIFDAKNNAKNAAKDTIRYYNVNFRKFCKFIDYLKEYEHVKIKYCKDITEDVYNAYIKYLKETTTMNDISLKTCVRAIGTFFKFCMKRNYILYFDIEPIKAQESIKEIYTFAELDKLLKKPDLNKCTDIEYRSWVIICLVYGTGIRLGTLQSLQIKDIDLDRQEIALKKLKNKSATFLPLRFTLDSNIKRVS